MTINVEKFLAITALIAGVGVAACTSSTDDDAADAGGNTGGSGGGTAGAAGQAGSAGAAGAAGQAGIGGAAGVAGSGGDDAGVDGSAGMGGAAGAAGAAGAGGACLDDTTESDAGVEYICDSLPYANADCDPGTEILAPFGSTLCWSFSGRLRDGVMEALTTCLIDVGSAVTDPCSTDHDDAVATCYENILPAACELTETAATCATITAGCSAIDTASCESTLNAFKPDQHTAILDCITNGATSTDTCDVIVSNCVWDPYTYF